MKDRIKALRKSLGITQAKFAEDLGVSLMAVQKWEMGHNNPSGAMIQLLASKYGVSEEWLRTGDGEMYAPKSREQELTEFVADLCSDDAPEFRRRLISVLARLDDDGWAVLEKIADALTEKD